MKKENLTDPLASRRQVIVSAPHRYRTRNPSHLGQEAKVATQLFRLTVRLLTILVVAFLVLVCITAYSMVFNPSVLSLLVTLDTIVAAAIGALITALYKKALPLLLNSV